MGGWRYRIRKIILKGGILKKKIEEGPKGNRGVIFIRRYGEGQVYQ